MKKDYFTPDDPVNGHIFSENFDENRKRILKEWKARKEQIMFESIGLLILFVFVIVVVVFAITVSVQNEDDLDYQQKGKDYE